MLGLTETLHFDDDEHIACMFRSSIARTILHLVPAVLFLLCVAFLTFPLFHLGERGIVIFFTLLVFTLFYIFRKIITWLQTVFILTDRRLLVIQRLGVFKKQVKEIHLENINEILYDTRGFLQTLLRLGTVYLSLNTNSGQCNLSDMPTPQAVLDSISRQVSAKKRVYTSSTVNDGQTFQRRAIPPSEHGKHS